MHSQTQIPIQWLWDEFRWVRMLPVYGFAELRNRRLEGPWSEVTKAIHDRHAAVHALGAQRIATDIRIGTRTDREIAPGTGNEHKVTRVQELLASEVKPQFHPTYALWPERRLSRQYEMIYLILEYAISPLLVLDPMLSPTPAPA